jgi:zinc finger CCCH domain-containing protein 13
MSLMRAIGFECKSLRQTFGSLSQNRKGNETTDKRKKVSTGSDLPALEARRERDRERERQREKDREREKERQVAERQRETETHERETDRQTDKTCCLQVLDGNTGKSAKDRETERQRDRHRNRQRNRQRETETQKEAETDIQTDRQTKHAVYRSWTVRPAKVPFSMTLSWFS